MLRTQIRVQIRRLRREMTTVTTSAAPRKKAEFAKPYETPEQILQDGHIQTLLKESNTTTNTPLTSNERKIALLAHLSEKYEEPIPSNVFADFQTAEDIAQWYSKRLRPVGAEPHARSFIHNILGASETGTSLEDRIDLDREAVQNDLLSEMPSNLKLDPSTFRQPKPQGLSLRQKPLRQKWIKSKEHQ